MSELQRWNLYLGGHLAARLKTPGLQALASEKPQIALQNIS